MSSSFLTTLLDAHDRRTSRRDLFRGGAIGLLGSLAATRTAAVAAAPAMTFDSGLYASIGVTPVINCKGTFTIISGSLSLPEVKTAMYEASKHYVHIDELMEAAGRRIAEITGAEAAIATTGCAAALTHATAACIAGADPEKMQRLPDLTGMKDEVIAPDYSRNVYDHAIRMLGVRMVTVPGLDEMRRAIGPRTAMVMVLGSPEDTGPFGLEPIAKLAHEFDVPVLVDAAAEDLTIPNVHLERGADLVAYSGGKALRGPQSAGILIGRKDLIQASWLNSAPHHAFGRPMKVGKEDAMGMLAAVEMWPRRDHKAEWKTWEGWLAEIDSAVKKVSGISTEVLQPRGLSNRAPRLAIRWDHNQIDITGEEMDKYLWNHEPRIILASGSGNRREGAESSVTVMPWMMQPGDAKVVASVLQKMLKNPPHIDRSPKGSGPLAQVAGNWDLDMDFALGNARHTLLLEQDGDTLRGRHAGERTAGDLSGWVEGDFVHLSSAHRWEGARFRFTFEGKAQGDTIHGEVDLGEYGPASFTARRHDYDGGRRRSQPGKPQKNV